MRLYRDFRRRARSRLPAARRPVAVDRCLGRRARRVIDVIRDALHLFAEALAATGDRFALYGFVAPARARVFTWRWRALTSATAAVSAGGSPRSAPATIPAWARRSASRDDVARPRTASAGASRSCSPTASRTTRPLRRPLGHRGHAWRSARRQGGRSAAVLRDHRRAGPSTNSPYLFGTAGQLDPNRPPNCRELPLLYAALTG